jgi:hypothetical protein
VKTAPDLMREAARYGVVFDPHECGLNTYERQPYIPRALMLDIEDNLDNVMRLLLGLYYDDKNNASLH